MFLSKPTVTDTSHLATHVHLACLCQPLRCSVFSLLGTATVSDVSALINIKASRRGLWSEPTLVWRSWLCVLMSPCEWVPGDSAEATIIPDPLQVCPLSSPALISFLIKVNCSRLVCLHLWHQKYQKWAQLFETRLFAAWHKLMTTVLQRSIYSIDRREPFSFTDKHWVIWHLICSLCTNWYGRSNASLYCSVAT